MSHARLTGDAGQSLVELALTLPLLILILLGAAEFARFAWASIETTNAARAGVQYGAQTHITASDNAGMQAAALNDGVNLSGLTATPSHSCACSTAASTTVACSTALSQLCLPGHPSRIRSGEYIVYSQAALPLAWAADDIYCERLCDHGG